MSITIGSLFSGIGGLELGLERAGLGPVKWQVEIDPYCRAVLAKHWPGARRYEDVRVVGPELERVDLICGGFPCQDISSAGAKAGLSGAQSGLWWEYARVVRVVRPRFVVVENVGALASRGLDEVVGRLAEDGYDALWFPVAAADVGAPHLRERIFVVGYTDQHGEPDGAEHDEASGVSSLAHTTSIGLHSEENLSVVESERGGELQPWEPGDHGGVQWLAEPHVGRVAHGVPSRVDRIGALGNAVVPQVAEVVGWVVRGIAERVA